MTSRPGRDVARRDQLVAAYEAAFDGLVAATDGLAPEAWSAPTGCPGWDVHDQLSHCVGLERRLLGDPERDPDVVVPDLPHVSDDVSRAIERDVEARRGLGHDELRAEAREAFDRRRAVLARLRPEQLAEPTDSPVGRLRTSAALRLRIFDLTSHERDIRAAVGRLDGLVGSHVTSAAEQVLRLWARALPDRLEGAGPIAFRLPGHPPATLDPATGELSREEPDAADARATIHLAPSEALALGGGRADAPTVADVAVEGDTDLVERFVAVAGITF